MSRCKRVLCYLLGILLCFNFKVGVYAASDEVIGSDMLDMQAFREIIESMNELDNGQKVIIDNKWVVECQELIVLSPQSVNFNTKSASRKFTVRRLFKEREAFSITQTVSYMTNSDENSVTITNYNTYASVKLSDYTVTLANSSYSEGEIKNAFAIGTARYDVYSTKDGSCQIATFVSVYPDGDVRFSCEPL